MIFSRQFKALERAAAAFAGARAELDGLIGYSQATRLLPPQG